MSEKVRLDTLLVQRGLVESREKAKAVIMGGHVIVSGDREDKPGRMVSPEAEIELRNYEKKFVSRGGFKLEKALDSFAVALDDAICIDAGASTGGFTDCMLQRGANKVYAVDVGYGQLAWSLRTDERVVCMERTNVRYLTREQIPEPVDFVSIDVSFISLLLVMPPLVSLMKEDGRMITLIKPQFEAGKDRVGKNGVVRDPIVHCEVVKKVCSAAKELGLGLQGLTFSPIKGPKGNIEFLAYFEKGAQDASGIDPEEVVSLAHHALHAQKLEEPS
ncbi:MAG: TlyA family RNA methyltransferase [Clostridia bacterium]|nr:TlyA family RNA methyltransferase [Clostridia bacterium]